MMFAAQYPDKSYEALVIIWGDVFDEIAEYAGTWTAHHKDAPEDELLTASTPDEINQKMRLAWMARQP